jgi:FdrA protein
VIVLVSKPPSPEVAASLLGELADKPTVVALIGLEEPPPLPPGVRGARTMEEASAMALDALGLSRPEVGEGLARRVAGAADRLHDERRAVRGLFSGGTLCSESMAVMAPRLGPIYSNVPLREDWGLPPPDRAHLCLDLGEEEFTKGRPHPMIDPEPRAQQVLEHGKDPAAAVILIDVVLGHGAHADPAAILAPACEEVTQVDGGPTVVAYVAGTDQDLQDRGAQCRRLQDAGALLAPTGARAALMAAAVALREPELAAGAP